MQTLFAAEEVFHSETAKVKINFVIILVINYIIKIINVLDSTNTE